VTPYASQANTGDNMKRKWAQEELEQQWTLFPHELKLLKNKTRSTRMGFAILLKFFVTIQHEIIFVL
jgi:hypothetical protein